MYRQCGILQPPSPPRSDLWGLDQESTSSHSEPAKPTWSSDSSQAKMKNYEQRKAVEATVANANGPGMANGQSALSQAGSKYMCLFMFVWISLA
jgi:hypothetical protein